MYDYQVYCDQLGQMVTDMKNSHGIQFCVKVSTDEVSINRERKLFITEMSMIADPGITPVAIQVISSRTELVATFTRSNRVRGCNLIGDVLWWIYMPSAETLVSHPRLADWKIQVFND